MRACYEAGPTRFGLYRAAAAAGVGMEVIAQQDAAPRGPSDRVKTDRRDQELLARCLFERAPFTSPYYDVASSDRWPHDTGSGNPATRYRLLE